MNWRSSVEWELRARLSPERLAGGLAILVVLALIGIVGLAQSDHSEPARGRPTAQPGASASRDQRATLDVTRARLIPVPEEEASRLRQVPGLPPVIWRS
jgi:hypothetical protein